MAGLYVTENGEEIKEDAARYILLYMPLELLDQVNDFLKEYNLDKKFDVFSAQISVRPDEEDSPISDTVESLILRMKNDKVLFEYKLRGDEDKILEMLHEYFYGKEED